MTPDDLNNPTVPIAYVHLNMQLAEERGVRSERLLDGVAIDRALLDQPDALISLLDYGRICLRTMSLTGEAAMGYEFGLRNNMTLHGFYGFGVMSQPTVREAIEFGIRFAPLRLPGWALKLRIEGDSAYIQCVETVPFGMLRQYAQEMMLLGLFNSFEQFLPNRSEVEIWFHGTEPDYHGRYAHRLPPCRFATGDLRIRLPATHLATNLPTANLVTARLVARECEREMALLGRTQDVIEQVRAEIRLMDAAYPDLDAVARRLYMSPRTLKRRLKAHQLSFRELLNDQRQRDSIRLLEDRTLSIEEVAARVGYSAPANFVRAFRSWTGHPPGEFRRMTGRRSSS